MTRFPRLRPALYLLGLTAFFAFLGALAWTLYEILPPRPRWTVEVDMPPGNVLHPMCFAKDGIVFGFCKDRREPYGDVRFSVRDLANGREKTGFWKADIESGLVIDSHLLTIASHTDTMILPADDDAIFFLCGDAWLRGVSERSGKVWDVALPAGLKNIAGVRRSPEDDLLAILVTNPEEEPHALILDGDTGTVLDKLPYAERRGGAIRFTPRYVISLLPADGKLILWDRATRKLHREAAIPGYPRNRLYRHAIFISHDALVFQGEPDDDSAEGMVVLWDLPDLRRRTELGRFPMDSVRFAFSPDGRLLLVLHDTPEATRSARIWDAAAGNLVAEVSEFPSFDLWFTFGQHMRFSPDGRHLAVFAGGLTVFDSFTGKHVWRKPTAELGDDRHWRPFNKAGTLLCPPRPHDEFLLKTPTGESILSIGSRAAGHVQSADGRYLFQFGTDLGPPGAIEEFLKSWLPEEWFSVARIKGELFDLETGAGQSEILWESNLKFAINPALSNDGRSLVTFVANEQNSKLTVACWDLPAARRWEWVAGLPAGIGLVGVGVVLFWARRRGKKAVGIHEPRC